MSSWLYINGTIKVFSYGKKRDDEILEYFEDFDITHPHEYFTDITPTERLKFIPCGSEGPIKYNIIDVSCPDSISEYLITIDGSLRDCVFECDESDMDLYYSTANTIEGWIRFLMSKLDISELCIDIFDGCNKSRVLQMHNFSNKLVTTDIKS